MKETNANNFSKRFTLKKILVVGSWAKEQITIENLKMNSDIKVFVYMDTINPGIVSIVDGYKIGKLSRINDIVEYAKIIEADLVIITTALPLSLGLVDILEKEKIPSFGPNKFAAKLESDKGFARELMKKYKINALPEFKIFYNSEEAIEYAKSLNWNVVVKPVGLTEGLGVKASGDQLKDDKEVIDYIRLILNNRNGEESKVLIEEKLSGEEFTLQCFVNDNIVIPTPAVQDFKKLQSGDKGLNTASMGSYSDIGYLLPFMKQEDYDTALEIIKKTINAFHSETGLTCCGVLYGQFMLTEKGVKLIEYNFRPGDPEWLNILSILKENILEIIKRVLNKEQIVLHFENQATVCKYLVPVKYPVKLNEVLDISFNESDIKKTGCHIYYSCGKDSQGRLNVGSERGIALLAKDNSIYKANERIEKAISLIKGKFYYRNDIGTKEMIKSKIIYVNTKLRKKGLHIRKANEEEFMNVYRFVSQCKPLENYAEHFYKIMLRYFGNTCFIAEYENMIVGFVLGFVSQVLKGTFFLWQIGISPLLQGKGIGSMLLETVEKEVQKMGCSRIEVTIDPENRPSQRLFEKRGYRNISTKEGETVMVNGNIAVKDYYKPGRHFMLYEKIF